MKRRKRAQEIVAFALATGSTTAAAARHAGVGLRTVQTWLTQPEFQKMVQGIRSDILERASAKLVNILTCAVDTFRSLLTSESDTVKLGAGRAIMDCAARLHEMVTLEERIRKLEEREPQQPDQATGD